MKPYDIAQIFAQMELDLIASMKRNLERHEEEEKKLGIEWEQWQSRKLQGLAKYREENKKLIQAYSAQIDGDIDERLKEAFTRGARRTEGTIRRISTRVKHFASFGRFIGPLTEPIASVDNSDESFFRINERRMNALITSTRQELRQGQQGMLRMADDVYRQTIFKAQVFHNAGAKSLNQAIDMATRDFLDKGFNTITFSDGRQMNIASYAEMALRTASQRAVFTGEGAKREEWGIHTVVVSAHPNCSELCLPWQGRVYIDDVYSGGKAGDGDYPLLSTAMRGGLFHPNCRHNKGTYFPGISELPKPVDNQKALATYKAEQKQRYMERQIRKYSRREVGSTDPLNQAAASAKVNAWKKSLRDHVGAHEQLRLATQRENIVGGISSSKRKEILKNNDMFKKYKDLLGDGIIPNMEVFDKLRNSADWPLVQLDFKRRERLKNNVELALPGAITASAAEEKFTKYLFNPDNPKGLAKGNAFTSRLGYNADNWDELRQEILKQAKLNPARKKGANDYGDIYEQKMVLYGKNGSPANVVAGWIRDENSTKMTSTYIKEVKVDEEN